MHVLHLTVCLPIPGASVTDVFIAERAVEVTLRPRPICWLSVRQRVRRLRSAAATLATSRSRHPSVVSVLSDSPSLLPLLLFSSPKSCPSLFPLPFIPSISNTLCCLSPNSPISPLFPPLCSAPLKPSPLSSTSSSPIFSTHLLLHTLFISSLSIIFSTSILISILPSSSITTPSPSSTFYPFSSSSLSLISIYSNPILFSPHIHSSAFTSSIPTFSPPSLTSPIHHLFLLSSTSFYFSTSPSTPFSPNPPSFPTLHYFLLSLSLHPLFSSHLL